ncbi:pseudouridine synthase, partial [Pavlovales sp. CCMP2436]
GVRVNKALRATHSRREADKIIADGRVLVNGQLAQPGDRLVGGERVELDGRAIDWERLNVPAGTDAEDPGAREGSPFAYLKYWKPAGVETTTNRQIRGNIIDELGPIPGVEDRIVPVGRLDLASTGLILLTSDGGCINGLLRASEQKEKVYLVELGMRATDEQVVQLCEGVVITTVSQRDGVSKPLTAATRPCIVDRVSPSRPNALRFVLQEGRNRQIRRMCEALGLYVQKLHRVGFAGITLDGCAGPGAWCLLTDEELCLI